MSRHGPRSKRLLLGPGHIPPRKTGCPLKLLLVPVLLPLALLLALARHRAPDQPARPDPRPDRLGAHTEQPHPFRDDLKPARPRTGAPR